MKFELCIESVDEALMAQSLGIQRVELCSALDLEGLSPTFGYIKQCAEIPGIQVMAMIRPRSGDFCNSPSEAQIMLSDIEQAAKAGAHGVVFGLLNSNGDLDSPLAKKLIDHAKSFDLEVTFHRAFDLVNDPFQCMEQLIELGFDRILTSGQKPTAPEGIDLIGKLVKQADGRITIMPGAGIDATNALDFQTIGCSEIHFAARKALPWNEQLNMGKMYQPDREKATGIVELCRK